MAIADNPGPWIMAEQLARRIYGLSTTPMRSEYHPTWDPVWRQAIEGALAAIGSGDQHQMSGALVRLNRLAETL